MRLLINCFSAKEGTEAPLCTIRIFANNKGSDVKNGQFLPGFDKCDQELS
jgi:hypothetical protein